MTLWTEFSVSLRIKPRGMRSTKATHDRSFRHLADTPNA